MPVKKNANNRPNQSGRAKSVFRIERNAFFVFRHKGHCSDTGYLCNNEVSGLYITVQYSVSSLSYLLVRSGHVVYGAICPGSRLRTWIVLQLWHSERHSWDFVTYISVDAIFSMEIITPSSSQEHGQHRQR